MIIKSINLKNFRNYSDEKIEFHNKINIITGNNAQGKTNLIEAINLLSLSKSFRTKRESEMIMEGKDYFSVKGSFEKEGRDYTVEIIQNKDNSQKRKLIINNYEKSKITDLLGGVYTIVFSPEDIGIIKGNPEGRRGFLDREIILLRPLYYSKLKKYRRLLKNRNLLLKEENIDLNLLEVYDEALSEAGAEVLMERLAYIKILSEAGRDNGRRITNEKETLDLKYESNIYLGEEDEESDIKKIQTLMYEELKKTREKDIKIGSTEKGPHRDDFSMLVNDKDLRVFGSQGQKRTAALSLKLAEEKLIKEETGEKAIILFDDVMSELDADRQKSIMENFEDNQIFITAAEINDKVISKLSEGMIFNIDNGQILTVSRL